MDNNPIGLNDVRGLKAGGGEATFSDGTVMKKPSKGNWFKRAGESMKNFFKESVPSIKKSVISAFTFKQKTGAKQGDGTYVDKDGVVHLETIHITKRSWFAKTLSKVLDIFENAKGGYAGYSKTGGDDADKNDALLGTTKRKGGKDVSMLNYDEMSSLTGIIGTTLKTLQKGLKGFVPMLKRGTEMLKGVFESGETTEGIEKAVEKVNTTELRPATSKSIEDKVVQVDFQIHEKESWSGVPIHGYNQKVLKIGDTIIKRMIHQSGKIDTIIPNN